MVSVIVPVYNVEKYIEKCLNSLVNQTLKDIEIILIDDGSTDSSGRICDQYAQKYENVVVLHKFNSGQADARNEGLKIANGDYIGFVDSDDWVDLNYYEKLYSYAMLNNLDMVVCNRRVYDDKGLSYQTSFASNKYYTVTSVENYFYENFFKYTPSSCNKIYRKDIIKNIKFKPVKKVGSEDALFNFEIMLNLKTVGEIEKIYYNSFARENSTARSYNGGMLSKNYNLLQELLLSLEDKNIDSTICYLIFNYFQQKTWVKIKNYSSSNKVENLKKELLEERSLSSYKNVSKKMLFLPDLERMGYKKTGRFAIKLMYLFKVINANYLLEKYIYILFLK